MSAQRPVRANSSVLVLVVEGGSALSSVSFFVFAPRPGVAHGAAQTQPGGLLERGIVYDGGVGDRELEETGGSWSTGTVQGDTVSAVGTGVVSQVPGGFADASESERAL